MHIKEALTKKQQGKMGWCGRGLCVDTWSIYNTHEKLKTRICHFKLVCGSLHYSSASHRRDILFLFSFCFCSLFFFSPFSFHRFFFCFYLFLWNLCSPSNSVPSFYSPTQTHPQCTPLQLFFKYAICGYYIFTRSRLLIGCAAWLLFLAAVGLGVCRGFVIFAKN